MSDKTEELAVTGGYLLRLVFEGVRPASDERLLRAMEKAKLNHLDVVRDSTPARQDPAEALCAAAKSEWPRSDVMVAIIVEAPAATVRQLEQLDQMDLSWVRVYVLAGDSLSPLNVQPFMKST